MCIRRAVLRQGWFSKSWRLQETSICYQCCVGWNECTTGSERRPWQRLCRRRDLYPLIPRSLYRTLFWWEGNLQRILLSVNLAEQNCQQITNVLFPRPNRCATDTERFSASLSLNFGVARAGVWYLLIEFGDGLEFLTVEKEGDACLETGRDAMGEGGLEFNLLFCWSLDIAVWSRGNDFGVTAHWTSACKVRTEMSLFKVLWEASDFASVKTTNDIKLLKDAWLLPTHSLERKSSLGGCAERPECGTKGLWIVRSLYVSRSQVHLRWDFWVRLTTEGLRKLLKCSREQEPLICCEGTFTAFCKLNRSVSFLPSSGSNSLIVCYLELSTHEIIFIERHSTQVNLHSLLQIR